MHSYPIGRGVSVSIVSPGFGFRSTAQNPSASIRFICLLFAFLALFSGMSIGSAAVLVHELQLTAVEVDQFWSFVRTKQGALRRAPTRTAPAGSGGGAAPSTGRRAS